MIKKILSTLLVSSVLFVFATANSFAERPTFAIGLSAAYGGYVASGTELEGKNTPQDKTSAEESGEIGYTSLFIEASFLDRITLGASWMAEDVTTGMTERTDSLCTAQATNNQGNPIPTCALVGNEGTSSVKATFSNLVTGYVELNLWNGLYAKYGVMEMDLETKESLHTDSSYPNTTMDGETYGLGWKGSWDNGVFIKTETLMQNWSQITLNGTGATDTDNNTSVTADLTGAIAQISLGKAF
tara:strand:- start:29 stop:757 length:729 start_codon:yes stop_codon:yes gene_type:complete